MPFKICHNLFFGLQIPREFQAPSSALLNSKEPLLPYPLFSSLPPMFWFVRVPTAFLELCFILSSLSQGSLSSPTSNCLWTGKWPSGRGNRQIPLGGTWHQKANSKQWQTIPVCIFHHSLFQEENSLESVTFIFYLYYYIWLFYLLHKKLNLEIETLNTDYALTTYLGKRTFRSQWPLHSTKRNWSRFVL